MTIDTLPNYLPQSPVCSEMPTDCVVQKFGGTSLGKFPLNIVNNVIMLVVCTKKQRYYFRVH